MSEQEAPGTCLPTETTIALAESNVNHFGRLESLLKAFNFQEKAWRVNCLSFWSIRVASTVAAANLPLRPSPVADSCVCVLEHSAYSGKIQGEQKGPCLPDLRDLSSDL